MSSQTQIKSSEIFHVLLFCFAIASIVYLAHFYKPDYVKPNKLEMAGVEPSYETPVKTVYIPEPIKEPNYVILDNGEYLPMKAWILEHMSFPDSYKHVSTQIQETGTSYIVTSTINGHTLSGEDVNQTVTVEFGLNGEFMKYIP